MSETLAVQSTQPDGLSDAVPLGGCVTADITEGRAAESQLQPADERLEDLREARRSLETLQIANTLYQSSTEAILLSDPDNIILDVNPAFTRILGYTLDEVRGRNPRMFKSGLQKTAFYRELWTSLRDLGRWQGELWNRHKDGRMIALWYTISVVRDAAGAPRRYVAQFSDATDRKHHEAALWRQASFDPLTNLPNRRLFRDRLEQEVRRAQAGNHPVALIYIDLDRFKDVNEVLGHDRGDYLLMEVAVRIAACVEDRDRVGHLGGDKFAVMVAGEGPCAAVDALASRIVESLALPYDLGGPNRYHAASASAGIALYAQGCDGVESLFKQAEQGMYEAKRLGRKRVAHFRPQMQREADEKFQLGNEMREAIEQGQLVVHYQPIVDLATRRIAKAEALVRWQHPRRGLLLPGVFVDIAEQYGLLRALGESVFQQALDTAARWQQAFGRVIPISINVSPVQMLDEAATAHWVEAIHRRGLPGSAIAIEALEAVMMQDSPVLRQRLLEFREAGIDVLIDDFGTGYSNYKRLRENHIDFLKIDRSFTRDLDSSADDRAISKAIIGMAHELGIRTIAEGVETQAVCDILQDMGCDYVQGFLFHRPLSRSDFEARIREEAG